MSRPASAARLITRLAPIAALLAVGAGGAGAQVYLDAAAPTEARVDDLLGRMTVEEKAGQMTQVNYQLVNPVGDFSSPAVELDESRLTAVLGTCALGSFLNGSGVPAADYVRFITRLQEANKEQTRLGIPFLYGIDHTHGAQYLEGGTIFPQPVNVAATFDTTHAAVTGRVTAREAAPLGHAWTFSPVLDVTMDVRWPRLWETFGEDPYLASVMGASYTRALQAERVGPYHMVATAKHFVGYGDPRSGWDRTPARIPDQALWEFHVPSFRAAIDAGIAAVMVNSGEVNGVPVHASRALLTGLLRERLGFDGLVVTDWGDVAKLVQMHRVAETERDAARLVVEAGVDMSMTAMDTRFCTDVAALVRDGELTEARLDESVRRILRLKFELGLFETPSPTLDYVGQLGAPEHRAASRAAAAASLVLLANDTLATGRQVLPLAAGARVLVAGPLAQVKAPLSGGWTYNWQGAREDQVPGDILSVADAIRQSMPGAVVGDSALAPGGAAAFTAQADAADAVVLVVGETPYTEFVGNVVDLTLPPDQQALVDAAAASDTPVVLVVVGGRPLAMTDALTAAGAVVWAGLPGFDGAPAIADLLAGVTAPSGRLPFSWPRGPSTAIPYHHKTSAIFHLGDTAALANDPTARAGVAPTLYPFGYGLRYGRVTTGAITLSDTTASAGRFPMATVTVSNETDRPVRESVLWFVTDEVGSVTRPVRMLKHVEMVDLAPGERREVRFALTAADLSYPDSDGRPVLEPGAFTVSVGEEAASFRLQ